MVSSDYSKKTRCDMKQKNGFSGQIGFVFAAAGSAVGVGNLWRFPYLAAKDGGGLFLVIYLIWLYAFDNGYSHRQKDREKRHLCL